MATQINIDIVKTIDECQQCIKCRLSFFQVNVMKINRKATEVQEEKQICEKFKYVKSLNILI